MAAILVFLPTYNEKENIEQVLSKIFQTGLDIEVLVIDDCSPDGTADIAEAFHSDSRKVAVIRRKGKRGRGIAGALGLKMASQSSADYVIEMDADLSHDPNDIPKLVSHCKDVDVVIGSRYIKGGRIVGWSLYRHINSRVANFLARFILNLKTKDATSGFRCFRRNVLEMIDWNSFISDGPFVVEESLLMIQNSRCKIKEIPITFTERKFGVSKVSPKLVLKWIITLLKVKKRNLFYNK